MSYVITASLAALRAARTHAADKDIRSYLCGVYLDTKHGFIVATDGHRLFSIVEPGVCKPHAEPVVIPNALLDSALKQFAGDYSRGKLSADVDVVITVAGAALTIATPHGQVQGQALAGQFPDWRRVIPKDTEVGDNVPAVLNWQYVADACDAFAILRNVAKSKASQHPVRVHYRGDSPAILTDGTGNAVALIMPLRNEIPANAAAGACARAHIDTTPITASADADADAA